MHIFVRRGGPNYEGGLAAMREVGAELGVPIQVGVLGAQGSNLSAQMLRVAHFHACGADFVLAYAFWDLVIPLCVN